MTISTEQEKDLELAGTIVSQETVSNALNGLYARSPCKTPLLTKKHVEACLKFAAQHLDKPVNYWENTPVSWEQNRTVWKP